MQPAIELDGSSLKQAVKRLARVEAPGERVQLIHHGGTVTIRVSSAEEDIDVKVTTSWPAQVWLPIRWLRALALRPVAGTVVVMKIAGRRLLVGNFEVSCEVEQEHHVRHRGKRLSETGQREE